MKHMQKVMGVEMHREVDEVVLKDKRHDYAAGGFVHVERIERTTREYPRVLLECGHYRRQHAGMKSIVDAARLLCYECERIEYAATAT